MRTLRTPSSGGRAVAAALTIRTAQSYLSRMSSVVDHWWPRMNPAPSPSMLGRRYFHGTPREAWAKQIAKNGIRPPSETVVKATKRGQMMPVVGRVYVTPHLSEAQIYALGANFAGTSLPASVWKDDGRYGFVFVVPGSALLDVDPDEDSIGEAMYYAFNVGNERLVNEHSGPLAAIASDPEFAARLTAFAARVLTPKQKRDIKDGHYPAWASGGKRALKAMSDGMKLDLIERGAHVAHGGILVPSEMWRLDKTRSSELEKDGSNFFDIAEQVRGSR